MSADRSIPMDQVDTSAGIPSPAIEPLPSPSKDPAPRRNSRLRVASAGLVHTPDPRRDHGSILWGDTNIQTPFGCTGSHLLVPPAPPTLPQPCLQHPGGGPLRSPSQSEKSTLNGVYTVEPNSAARLPVPANRTTTLDGQPRLRAASACQHCRLRRTRCTGASPCKRCVELGLDCFYVSLGGRKKKTKRLGHASNRHYSTILPSPTVHPYLPPGHVYATGHHYRRHITDQGQPWWQGFSEVEQVIRHGPYNYVQHPSETGYYFLPHSAYPIDSPTFSVPNHGMILQSTSEASSVSQLESLLVSDSGAESVTSGEYFSGSSTRVSQSLHPGVIASAQPYSDASSQSSGPAPCVHEVQQNVDLGAPSWEWWYRNTGAPPRFT